MPVLSSLSPVNKDERIHFLIGITQTAVPSQCISSIHIWMNTDLPARPTELKVSRRSQFPRQFHERRMLDQIKLCPKHDAEHSLRDENFILLCDSVRIVFARIQSDFKIILQCLTRVRDTWRLETNTRDKIIGPYRCATAVFSPARRIQAHLSVYCYCYRSTR